MKNIYDEDEFMLGGIEKRLLSDSNNTVVVRAEEFEFLMRTANAHKKERTLIKKALYNIKKLC